MKAKLLLTSAAAILAFVLSIFPAQADSRSVKVQPFTKIKASTGMLVIYEEGPLKPVQITALSKHIDNIVIEMDDETLIVYYRRNDNGNVTIKHDEIEIRVTAPKVHSFRASSGAKIIIKNDLYRNSEFINANSSSGGKIKFNNITTSKINLSASSGSSISADNINLSSSGNIYASSGSNIDIETIDATTANISIKSAGKLKINSMKADHLNIEASSASKVTIHNVTTPIANVLASSVSKVILSGKIDHKIFEASSLSSITYNDTY